MRRLRLRMLVEFDEVAGEGADPVTEGEIMEAMDGAFEMLLSEEQGESIDELEAAVVRMQYEVNRRVLARQLTQIAQKKLDELREARDASLPTQRRIELRVNLGATSSRRSGSSRTRGR
jgi:hypothetical protein